MVLLDVVPRGRPDPATEERRSRGGWTCATHTARAAHLQKHDRNLAGMMSDRPAPERSRAFPGATPAMAPPRRQMMGAQFREHDLGIVV
jgi:hypothetical protein